MKESTERSRHLSVWIAASPEAVYAFASDPRELGRWAAGLADPALADADVRFAPANEFGVLDHVVTLPTGEAVYNPMRVIDAEEGGSEVVFSLRRRPGMTDAEFEADADAVSADLEALRALLEG